MKTRNLFCVLIIILISLLPSVGYCSDSNEEKAFYKAFLKMQLNSTYDRHNRGSFCYVVGEDIELPYQLKKKLSNEFYEEYRNFKINSSNQYYSPSFYQELNLYKLNQILSIYYESGLLNRELISEDSSEYEYSLTNEGKKYVSTIGNQLLFCYGYKIIDEVTEISESLIEYGKYKGETSIIVEYIFRLKDYPEWPKSEKLVKMYASPKYQDGSKGQASEPFILTRQDELFPDDDEFNNIFFEPSISRVEQGN